MIPAHRFGPLEAPEELTLHLPVHNKICEYCTNHDKSSVRCNGTGRDPVL